MESSIKLPSKRKKIKLKNLINQWNRPKNKYNLKFWIIDSNKNHSLPSLGIGLGTIKGPNIFTFALLDDNSIEWLEQNLAEAIKIYKNAKNIDSDNNNPILWLKKKDLDKLRKINISLSVIKKDNRALIQLNINSKASLFTDLNLDDINWIYDTLNIAKYTLDEVSNNE